MTFKEKVQSMTFKELVLAMTTGLRNKHVEVDMSTFGEARHPDDFVGGTEPICFGCAATNAVCQISGVKFSVDNVFSRLSRSEVIDCPVGFLEEFEAAVNALRVCDWYYYSSISRRSGLPSIPDGFDTCSVCALSNNYSEHLQSWEDAVAYL